MRLYDEIFKNADGGAMQRCVIVPEGGGYFEGVKGVEEFSPERLVLRFPRQRVELTGKGLSIQKYYGDDLQIDGRICKVEVLSPEGGKE